MRLFTATNPGRPFQTTGELLVNIPLRDHMESRCEDCNRILKYFVSFDNNYKYLMVDYSKTSHSKMIIAAST